MVVSEKLFSELKQVGRSAWVRRVPTTAFCLVLSIPIAVVTIVFALADPFLFRALPYKDADRLVLLSVRPSTTLSARRDNPRLSNLRSRSDLFSDVALVLKGGPTRMLGPDRALVLRIAEVSDTFFDVLGVDLPFWRDILRSRSDRVVRLVLTPSTETRLGSSDRNSMRAFQLHDGSVGNVAGILPPTFVFPPADAVFPVEAITPIAAEDPFVTAEHVAIARLRDGVSPPVVKTALATDLAVLRDVDVSDLREKLTRRTTPVALAALIASIVLLVICTGNVANVFLVRSANRALEFSTRLALGATWVHLVRVMLLELALCLVFAVAIGVVLATFVLHGSRQLMPAEYLTLGQPSIGFREVVCAVSAALGIMFGVAAVQYAVLRRRWRRRQASVATDNYRSARVIRAGAIAVQVALSIVLAIGSTALVRSAANLFLQDTGFDHDALVLSVSYPPGFEGARLALDIDKTISSLERLPGVMAAGAAIGSTVDRLLLKTSVNVDGQAIGVVAKQVSESYFRAAGTRFVAGVPFTETDSVVINEALARQLRRASVLGHRLPTRPAGTIVGVVKDEYGFTLDRSPSPTLYTRVTKPWEQCTGAACGQVSYVLRSDGRDQREFISAAITTLRSINADAIVFEAATIGDRLVGTVKTKVFATMMTSLFAFAALLICTAGTAAMVAFTVANRTKEIAIRMTVGASTHGIICNVIGDTTVAAVIGIGGGLLLGHGNIGLAEHLLYGVKPGEWLTDFYATIAVLLATTFGCATAAIRALRLSPADALRVE